jgi:hypothetical protein
MTYTLFTEKLHKSVHIFDKICHLMNRPQISFLLLNLNYLKYSMMKFNYFPVIIWNHSFQYVLSTKIFTRDYNGRYHWNIGTDECSLVITLDNVNGSPVKMHFDAAVACFMHTVGIILVRNRRAPRPAPFRLRPFARMKLANHALLP